MKVKEKVAGLLSLPKEIALNLPMITVTGRMELNVENYKNIVEYTDGLIRVNTASGLLCVEGKRLIIKQITSENIVIAGEIGGVRYGDAK